MIEDNEEAANIHIDNMTEVSSEDNIPVNDESTPMDSNPSTLDPVRLIVKSKDRFPVSLLKVDSTVPLGEKIVMFILKHAKANGGYDNSFGHRKKLNFLTIALEHLFSECGPLNQ